MTTQPPYTTQEAADRLRVTPATIRRYAKAGLLPRLAVNQRVHRYSADAVEALLNGEGAAANGASVNPPSDVGARHDRDPE